MEPTVIVQSICVLVMEKNIVAGVGFVGSA